MEVVYRCCCGIDVHKKIIVACLNQGGEQSLRDSAQRPAKSSLWQPGSQNQAVK